MKTKQLDLFAEVEPDAPAPSRGPAVDHPQGEVLRFPLWRSQGHIRGAAAVFVRKWHHDRPRAERFWRLEIDRMTATLILAGFRDDELRGQVQAYALRLEAEARRQDATLTPDRETRPPPSAA